MQQSKIQALWQMCQELKHRREVLMQQMQSNQEHLDQQQWAMSEELHRLKDANDDLSEQVQHLSSHVLTLHQSFAALPAASSPAEGDTLALDLNRHAGELHFARSFQQQLSDAHLETYQTYLADFEQWQAYFAESGGDPEALQATRDFLADFGPRWTALKSKMVNTFANSTGDSDTSSGELLALEERYGALASQLSTVESLYQSRSALLDQLQKTHQSVHYEFQNLKADNETLTGELGDLKGQVNQLMELVENYRQAALEAYAEVEKMQEAAQAAGDTSAPSEEASENASTASADFSPEEMAQFESKAEAIRDTVRKKINALLRHRFGKAPRSVSSGLKAITQNRLLDQLFDQALEVESIEAFEALLQSEAGATA